VLRIRKKERERGSEYSNYEKTRIEESDEFHKERINNNETKIRKEK